MFLQVVETVNFIKPNSNTSSIKVQHSYWLISGKAILLNLLFVRHLMLTLLAIRWLFIIGIIKACAETWKLMLS
jgi:hypothetical protein